MKSDSELQPEGLDPEERKRRIERIGEDFLDEMQKGLNPEISKLVEQHPDLAPELQSRLKLLEAVFHATHPSQSDAVGSERTENLGRPSQFPKPGMDEVTRSTPRDFFRREATLRIKCPHCGNVVQIVTRQAVQEVTCDSCGSAVIVDTEATRSESSDHRSGEFIGRFRIKRLLGQGAFGSVFLANDPDLGRDVAIKVPRQGYFSTVEERHRFFREAQSAANLRHSNIVSVYEVSNQKDTPFIVSEFVDGLTLEDLVSGGMLSFRQTAKLMIQICHAIDYAHENHLVHRDIKPSNILIDNDFNPYVTDFGLARQDNAEITMTVDGVILGTPAYMSPEQAAGKHQYVDQRSDIYSLGVVLYRMLCRELPFGGTKRMLLHQVIHDDPKSPRRLNDAIPRDLETITMKALSKDPAQRFQTASEMADELHRWLDGRAILSRPISSYQRFWRLCKRFPIVTALAATIAFLLIAGTIGSIIYARFADGLRRQAQTYSDLADERREETEQQLNQNYRRNGQVALDAEKLNEAGYWFAKSLEIRDDPVTRIRLGLILDRIPKLKQLFDVGEDLESMRFNDSGTRLAVGRRDGRVFVFDVANGKPVFEQSTSGMPVYLIEFLLDGNLLAFKSDLKTIQVWDINANQLVKEINSPEVFTSIAVNSQGDLLATGGDATTLKLWRLPTGDLELEKTFENANRIARLEFVPGTDLLMVQTSRSGSETSNFDFFNIQSEEIESAISDINKWSKIDFSIDGSRMLTAGKNNQVIIWEIETGKRVGEQVIQIESQIVLAYFGESTDHVVIVEEGGRVSNWNANSASQISTAHQEPIRVTGIGRDSARKLIAFQNNEGVTRIIRSDFGSHVVSRLVGSNSRFRTLFHPNGREIAIAGEKGAVHLWNLAGGIPKFREFQLDGDARTALFYSDDSRIVTVDISGVAKLWDVQTGKQIGPPLRHEDAILGCAVSPNDKMIGTVSVDKTARVWESESGQPVGLPMRHASAVWELAFSPDSEKLVTGCQNGEVVCWKITANTNDGPSPLFKVKHAGMVRRVVFNSTGDLTASASIDGTTRCWDANTGVIKFGPFKQPTGETLDCVFLENGRIATCGNDRLIRIWSLADGTQLQQLSCDGSVVRLKVAASGDIVSSDMSGTTKVWTERDGAYALKAVYKDRQMTVAYHSSYGREGELIVGAGGSDVGSPDIPGTGTAVLYEANDSSRLCPPFEHWGLIRRVQLNSKSTRMLTSSADATVRLWQLEPIELDVEDLVRVFRLYRQIKMNKDGKLVPMALAEQTNELAQLKESFPDYFKTTPTEAANWKRALERNGKDAQN